MNLGIQVPSTTARPVETSTPFLDVSSPKSVARWVNFHRDLARRAFTEADPTIVGLPGSTHIGEAVAEYLAATNRALLAHAARVIYGEDLGKHGISIVVGGGMGCSPEKPTTASARSDADLFALTRGSLESALPARFSTGRTLEDGVTKFLDVGLAVNMPLGFHQKCPADMTEKQLADCKLATLVLTLQHIAGDPSVTEEFQRRIAQQFSQPETLRNTCIELTKLTRGRHVARQSDVPLLEQNGKEILLRDIDTIGWLLTLSRFARESGGQFPELFVSKEQEEHFRQIRRDALLFKHALAYTADASWNHESDALNRINRDRMAAIGAGFPAPFELDRSKDVVIQLYVKLFAIADSARILLNGICAKVDEHFGVIAPAPAHQLLSPLHDKWSSLPTRVAEKTCWGADAAPLLIRTAAEVANNLGSADIAHSSHWAQPTIWELREFARAINAPIARLEGTTAAFREVLQASPKPSQLIDLFHHIGLLGKLIPDWERQVCCHLDLNGTHVYSLAGHSLRSLARFETLMEIGILGHPEFLERVDLPKDRTRVYLALLLHDSGKLEAAGRSGVHAGIGAKITDRSLRALGYSEDDVRYAADLVRMHNFFPDNAKQYARPSPETIRRLSEQIPSREFLVDLFLLCLADKISSNEVRWNETRTEALWALFAPLYNSFGTPPRGYLANDMSARGLSEFSGNHGPHIPEQEIQAHLDQLPSQYRRELSALAVVRHLQLVRQISQPAEDSAPQAAPRVESSWSRITADSFTISIVAPGQSDEGFLRHLSAFFASKGLSVNGASLYTRSDGVACNVFIVHRQNGIHDSIATNAQSELQQLLINQERLAAEAAAKRIPAAQIPESTEWRIAQIEKRRRELNCGPVTVSSELLENGAVNLVIRCDDAPGLLALISNIFAEHKISIRAARLGVDDRGVTNAFEIDFPAEGGEIITRVAETIKRRIGSQGENAGGAASAPIDSRLPLSGYRIRAGRDGVRLYFKSA